tara:strand:- start:4575 stop:5456 length:882 start_codon:yes stop_codon:yes gene_type:complete
MTGFAEGRKEIDSGVLGASIRSVNHRYLDLQIRLPSSFVALEQGLRSLLQERLTRGRVELLVTVQFTQLPEVEVELNEKMIRALGSALERSRDHGLDIKEITVSDLMRVPNALVIKEASSKGDAVKDGTLLAAITDLVSETLENLDGMRKQEGELLYGDLNSRHNSIEILIGLIDEGARESSKAFEERLRERSAEFAEAMGADPMLLAQEIIRVTLRSDISEELSRLRAHLAHWQMLVDSSDACGRRLDFLLQEMNREANTIGAKIEGVKVKQYVIDMKAEIERLREQVQNIE